MASLILYANIANLDIGYLKAGCVVDRLTFLETLWSVRSLRALMLIWPGFVR